MVLYDDLPEVYDRLMKDYSPTDLSWMANGWTPYTAFYFWAECTLEGSAVLESHYINDTLDQFIPENYLETIAYLWDRSYNLPDRGGFVHEGKAYRPYAWTMYVNTVTGVATVEYTLAELVAIPMAIEDWSNMTLVKVSDSFVYRLPDGFAASWINECVVEELISSHFMGTLVNPIKGRERDLTFIMLPRIGQVRS